MITRARKAVESLKKSKKGSNPGNPKDINKTITIEQFTQ